MKNTAARTAGKGPVQGAAKPQQARGKVSSKNTTREAGAAGGGNSAPGMALPQGKQGHPSKAKTTSVSAGKPSHRRQEQEPRRGNAMPGGNRSEDLIAAGMPLLQGKQRHSSKAKATSASAGKPSHLRQERAPRGGSAIPGANPSGDLTAAGIPLLQGKQRQPSKGKENQPPGNTAKGKSHPRREEDHRPLLHSGQTVELTIAGTDEEGFGVANHEGARVLIAGALPGEQVVARVTYVGRREIFANLLKCLKTSPDRNPLPACTLGKACDGCPLIQMRYPAQLAWKKELVSRHIGSYRSLSRVKIHDTIASPKELQYRNSAKLVIAGKYSEPVIGIYRRNSHDVLEIADCPLHHPLINKVVKAVRAGIKKGKVPVYNPKSEMGLLRYLVVRVAESGNAVMVVLVTSEQGYNEIHHLAKFIQEAVPEVAVVAQNINNSTGNVIFGQRDRFLTKMHTLRAYIGEKAFSLSPRSFFQVNSGAARIIYDKVREFAALRGEERVIDVYCGIGGISLFLADRAEEVVGIEVVDAAVSDATENAALNRIHNCTFEAGDASKLLEEIGEEGGAQVVVLNPPRKGCDAKVLESAAALQPEKIIYVSCSPETLARDLDVLSRLGYRTVEVQPVDMFPQTVHVEDVALLVRTTVNR